MIVNGLEAATISDFQMTILIAVSVFIHFLMVFSSVPDLHH